MRPRRWRALLVAGALLANALVFIWPLTLHPTSIPYAPGSAFTDLLISHLPNAAYLRETLWRTGQVPLWNAQLFAGQPFAADPLAGMWYPPNWLLLFAPLALGFNLLLALHLAWGGLGVYALARAEGVGAGAALLAALFFTGTPKLIAHLSAGHVSLIFAVAWTPWLLVLVRRAVAQPTWQRGAWAGAALALTFLADVRWAYYAGLLAVAYAAAAAMRGRPNWRPAVVALLGGVALLLLLSAPLAVPLVEFVGFSRRAALTVSEAGALSLPPLYFIGLLIPNLGGFHEYMTYLGVVTLLLALAGLGRRTLFWALAALVAAAFALGTNTFFYPLLFKFVPGVSLLRVPPRAWFVVALCACLLAAHGTQRLLTVWLPRLRARQGALLPLPGPRAALAALLVLGGLDLLRVDSTLLVARPQPAMKAAAVWVSQQPGLFRTYSPSYSLPPGDGLQHLDGVDPLQLAVTAAAIEQATGIAATGYSVTVPPFATTDLAHEHAGATPDAALLGRYNVRYIVSEFALDAPGLALAQRFGDTYVYTNAAWRDRAWVEGGAGGVVVAAWSPNRLVLDATGPGRLVISESAYPGWQVSVDGVPQPLETTADGLLAVTLAAGPHAIAAEFRPLSVYLGLGAAVVGLFILAVGALRAHRVVAA